MLKKALLYVLGGLICFSSLAQSGGKAPKLLPEGSSWIKGLITDHKKEKPLEYATVSVYRSKDTTLLGGTITNRRGEFQIEKLPESTVFLKVEFLGYHPQTINSLSLKKDDGFDVGKISLNLDTKHLGEVKVEGKHDFVKRELDRTVVRVSKSAYSEGGNLADVLQTVPQLNVDMDGNVSIRGNSNITVLIDGKASQVVGNTPADIIDQLPANSVDKVEVITSPTARHDASGTGGIINIIMKKDRVKGFNGTVAASAATGAKYRGNLAMNYRVGKFNWYGTYIGKDEEQDRDINIFREGVPDPSSTAVDDLEQRSDRVQNLKQHIGQVGMDFLPNQYNTIGYSLKRQVTDHDMDIQSNYRFLNPESNTARHAIIEGDQDSWLHNLTWLKTTERKGESLSFDFSYTVSNSTYAGKYSDRDLNDQTGTVIRSSDLKDFDRDTYIGQLDYIRPFGKGNRIESGLKYFQQDMFMGDGNELFQFDNDIYAGYFIYSGSWDKFAYQLGLRGEYTQVKTNMDFDPDYFDLFPSANFSYELPKKQHLTLSYSRRIIRPSYKHVNPFQNISNPNDYYTGTIDLDPEYQDMAELTYQKKWSKITLTSNLYYQRGKDVIVGIREMKNARTAVVRYQNLDQEDRYGMDLNFDFKLYKWWSISTALTGLHFKYDAPDNSGLENRNDNMWFGNIVSTMRLPKSWIVQISSRYDSEMPFLQGEYDDQFSLNLAVQKRFWKNKGILTLKIDDVFDARDFIATTSGVGFHQRTYFNYETRVAKLSFRYYFGKRYRIKRGKGKNFDTSKHDQEI